MLRRIVQVDQARGLELVINHYEPGTSNAATAVRHNGVEYGLLVEGSLTIELAGVAVRPAPWRLDLVSVVDAASHHQRRAADRAAIWVKLDADAADGVRTHDDGRERRWG